MTAVQIPFLKTLQTKLQEIYYTILKYKNVIIFEQGFVFIGLFLRPGVFVKKRENLNISRRENRHWMQISNFLKFWPQNKSLEL